MSAVPTKLLSDTQNFFCFLLRSQLTTFSSHGIPFAIEFLFFLLRSQLTTFSSHGIPFAIEFLFFFAQQPPVGHGLLIHEVSRSHTTTQHNQQDSSGWIISSTQRPLPYNTRHSQQTNVYAPVGFEPTISADERPQTYAFRPRCHWDPH